jgi:hypothetical protein
MATHRYWSIYITHTEGLGGNFGLSELEAYDTHGGTNLASAGIASLVGSSVNFGNFADIFDGNAFTGAQITGDGGMRIVLDFGAGNEKDIIEWGLCTSPYQADRGPGEFFTCYSDNGTTWVNQFYCHASGWVIGTRKMFVGPVDRTARYWTFFGLINPSGGVHISEFELRTALSTPLTPSGGTPTASEAPFGGFDAAKAVDGSTATSWAVGSSIPAAWWYDYGSGNDKNIVQVAVTNRPTVESRGPTGFGVGYSDDGVCYGIAGEFTSPSWSILETRVFTLTSVTPSPIITSIAPTSGTIVGGTHVTISGTDFTGTTDIKFDGTSATSIVVVNSTTITCDTPAHAAGVVDVDLYNPAGDYNYPASYTYTVATLVSLSPVAGNIAGGDSVTLTGTNLTGATDVKFDGTSATSIVVVDDSHVTCLTPAHAAGTVDVQIFTPAGNPSLVASYEYDDAPRPRITQVPLIVLDSSPQQSRVSQVPIIVLYQEEQPQRITQAPVLVMYTPKPVPLPSAIVPETPFSETWRWLTVVNEAQQGQEQRSRLRNVPRYMLQMNALIVDEADRVHIYNMLMRYLKTTFLYPVYCYNIELTVAGSIGDTKLYLNTTFTDLRDGEYAAVFDQKLEVTRYVKITTVDSDGINLETPLDFDTESNWEVCPAFKFRIMPVVGLNMNSLSGDMSVTMESVEPRAFQRPGATPTLTTIDGILIVKERYLTNDTVPESFDHGVAWFDNGTSIPDKLDEWSNPRMMSKRTYNFVRFNGMDYWRAVFDSLKGRSGVALFPTFKNDLPLRVDVALNVSKFTTFNIDFYIWWLELNFRYILIQTANGPKYRRVIDVQPHYDGNGDPDYITVLLSTSIGNTAGDNVISSISYMNLCRLDTDDVKLTHYEVDTQIEFTIKAVDK